MGYSEIIALIIVGMAVFFLIRKVLGKRNSSSCCGKKCPVSSKDSAKTSDYEERSKSPK